MREPTQPRVEKQIEDVREHVLRMGRLAQAILSKSLRSVWERSDALADEVQHDDLEIDRLDVLIDRAVLELLALQAPVARDLRQVIAIKTAGMDLERVGDLARNIAKSARRLNERPAITISPALRRLADASQRQLDEALTSFADGDAERARAVLAGDDEIDSDEDRFIRKAIEEIRNQPESSEQEVDLIFVAKNLERVGDHATNLAEDVVMVAESVNLKHAEKLAP